MALSAFVKEFFGRVQGVGETSAGVQVGIEVESDGTPKIVAYGKDSSGNQDPLRTNDNQQLQVEVIEGSFVQVDPVLIPNSEGLLWNPNVAATIYYKVMFNIVNTGVADVTVSVGQDIGAGGSLSAVEYWVRNLIVPTAGMSGWYGPYLIPGDDRVRGVASTNNELAIHWMIKRVA